MSLTPRPPPFRSRNANALSRPHPPPAWRHLLGGRFGLADVPEMRGARAEPEVGADRRIDVALRRAEEDRVVLRVADAIEERRGVEGDDIHRDANLLQIVANDRRAALVS